MERQSIFKNKNDEVIRMEMELSSLRSRGASAYEIEMAENNLKKVQNDRDEYKLKFFAEGQNGRAVATTTTAAEWDALVHTFEKQTRFQIESNLIKGNDVDAVTQLQKTIGMLKANASLGKGDSGTDKEIKSIIEKYMGHGVTSIDQIVGILENKDNDGNYDISPQVLENVKKVAEGLVRVTNQEALIASERAKRTQAAIQNDKKGS